MLTATLPVGAGVAAPGVLKALTPTLAVIQINNYDWLSDSISVGTAAYAALSNAISAVSQQLSLQVSALSQVHSVLSADVVSLKNRVSAISSTVSAEISDRISADNVLSNAISAVSQQLSLVASALSQQISVLAQQVSIVSAGLGGVQMKVLQGAFTVSVSTVTNISGLSASVAAGGTYEVQGQILWNMSLASAMGFGLSYPQMAAMAGDWEAAVSVNPGAASIPLGTSAIVKTYVMESAAAAGSNSAVCSITPGVSAGFTNRAKFNYLMNVSAAGTVQVVVKQAGASPGLVILKGSYIRAYKLA